MKRASIHSLILVVSLTSLLCPDLEGSSSPAKPFDQLSPSDRDYLLDWIHESRKQNPEHFIALQDLVVGAPQMAAMSHTGRVHFGPHFGQELRFLAPALELLMVAEPPLDQLSDRIWNQVRDNLIYAVGLMRDGRSLPSLVALLRCEVDPETTRLIAESIARLRSEQALEVLVAFADDPNQPEWFRHAVLTGLGAAKREIVAKRLADELYKSPPPEYARQLLKALGEAGNYSAWSISSLYADEEQPVRTTVSDAAVWAFLEYPFDTLVAKEAKLALYLSSYPETLTRIREYPGEVDEDIRLRLDKLHNDLQRHLKRTGRIPGQ